MTRSPDFRLRKHADYQRVYKAARKQFARQMAYFAAPRPESATQLPDTTWMETAVPGERSSLARVVVAGPRIGLTVPKALGNAVARNRIKRRLREAVRSALPLLSAPVDVVLHPRRTVLDADFAVLRREVQTIFRSVQAAEEKRWNGSATQSRNSIAAPPSSGDPRP